MCVCVCVYVCMYVGVCKCVSTVGGIASYTVRLSREEGVRGHRSGRAAES